MEIEDKVYRKLACHALKYPTYDVYGFLIGRDNHITDAIPFSHTNINSSLLHTALEILSRYIEQHTGDLHVVGLYDCVESFKIDDGEPQCRELILKAIQSAFHSRIVYSISANIKSATPDDQDNENALYKEAILAFDKRGYAFEFKYKSFDGKWKDIDSAAIKGKFDMESLRKDYVDQLIEKVVDIEDHLDTVEADFLNLAFNK